MSKWQKVFEDPLLHKASIIKSILSEHGINALILTKTASSYNNFGLNEVLVNRNEVLQAIKIIEDEVKFE